MAEVLFRINNQTYVLIYLYIDTRKVNVLYVIIFSLDIYNLIVTKNLSNLESLSTIESMKRISFFIPNFAVQPAALNAQH